MEGQVMRCQRYDDRWYDVGLQFGDPVAEAAAARKSRDAA
jgi:hypothetical protein